MNPNDFEAIYAKLRAPTYSYGRRELPESAFEDVVSGAWLNAWKHWDDFRGETANERCAWVWRIVRNAVLTHLRRPHVRRECPFEIGPDQLERLAGPDSAYAQAEARVDAAKLLEVLTRRQAARLRTSMAADFAGLSGTHRGLAWHAIRAARKHVGVN